MASARRSGGSPGTMWVRGRSSRARWPAPSGARSWSPFPAARARWRWRSRRSWRRCCRTRWPSRAAAAITGDRDDGVLTFEEARARVLAGVARLGSERVPLDGAAGRVLAETLVASAPLPPFDHSAMDGYALRISDLTGGGPFSLALAAEESRAGRSPPALEPGQAGRIFTGAALPAGADAVVMQED